MPITREQVRAVASLARLRLTDDEEVSLTADLDHILQAFDRLLSVDTTATLLDDAPATTPLRDDLVTNRPAPDDLLSQAPVREGRYFRVPKIIE